MSARRSQCSSPAGRVHFVGVGGIHMSALAGLVLDAGGTVSGSDLTLSPLTDALAARAGEVAVANARPLSKNAYKVPLTQRVVERTLLQLAARG